LILPPLDPEVGGGLKNASAAQPKIVAVARLQMKNGWQEVDPAAMRNLRKRV